MRRELTVAAALFAVLISLAAGADAKRAHERTDVTIVNEETERTSAVVGDMRVDAETGVAITVFRSNERVTLGEPEVMAREYLSRRAATFGLQDPTLDDLRLHHVRNGLAGHNVRLHQYLGDVRVYGAEIAVTFDATGKLLFVANSYRPSAVLAATNVALTEDQAWNIAFDHVGFSGTPGFADIEKMIYASAGPARIGYVVRFETNAEPFGDWEVIVDAVGGTVLKAVDKAHYIDGTGNVFDPDPLSSATVAYGSTGYTDGGDATTTQLDSQTFSRTLLDIEFTGLQYNLKGPWAEVQDFESPFKGLFPNATSDFPYNRTADNFEAVNTYYHIDTYMRYLNNTLGLSITPYQYATGVRFDPSGWNGADNSSYSSGSGRLSFGEGGVDDAEDADVIIHELGHALHDWVTVGGISQNQGLSEGLGDFAAASYSRAFGQWSDTDAAHQWVFSWDGHNPFWGGRRTDWPNSYPGGLTGQIHTDGQIWSTCLMRIWDQIGQQQIDRAVWEGIAMTGGSTNQLGAANAVLQAADAMGYPIGEIAIMVSEMEATGYNVTSPVAVQDGAAITPTTARLHAARPNPFKATVVGYELDEASAVRLAVYDVSGRLVRELVDLSSQGIGQYNVRWDGTDASGTKMASGVYYFELEAAGSVDRKRAVLIR